MMEEGAVLIVVCLLPKVPPPPIPLLSQPPSPHPPFLLATFGIPESVGQCSGCLPVVSSDDMPSAYLVKIS